MQRDDFRTSVTKQVDEIAALACLFRCAWGESVEDKSATDFDDADDWLIDTDIKGEDEEDIDFDVRSDVPDQITDVGFEKLKRNFLDRFAEFASKEKGWKHVTTTVLQEAEDEAVIWLSANDDMGDDIDKLKSIVESLSGIAAHKLSNERSSPSRDCKHFVAARKALTDGLWESMREYARPRLDYYISKVKMSLESFFQKPIPPSHQAAGASTHRAYKPLMLLRTELSKKADASTISTIVSRAYDVRKSRECRTLLRLKIGEAERKAALHMLNDVCLLARTKAANIAFLEAIDLLPSLSRINLKYVPYVGGMSAMRLTLEETLRLIPDTQRLQSAPKTMKKVGKAFSRTLECSQPVHAEIQLLFALEKDGLIRDVFPYMGGSKYSCFSCRNFLIGHGIFQTRGTHGSITHRWTVPVCFDTMRQNEDAICRGLNTLRGSLLQKLQTGLPEGQEAHPQSSAAFTKSEALSEGPGSGRNISHLRR